MAKKKKTNSSKRIKKEPIEKAPESFKKYYLIIAGIITMIFMIMYGIRILNPKYTDWIFASTGDIMQHYVGWEAYRAGSWTFPIGLTNTISYPTNISVIYTDAIPLVALFFKLISFILPKTFQYLGLYGLLCYILQGILAAKIVKKHTESKLNIIASAILFTIVPSMIFRMFYHTALASHWIILLALETIFLYDEFEDNKKIYYMWALIAFLISTIHIYYLVMCGIILVGYITLDILKTKKIKKSILLLITYIFTSLITIWFFGGFTNIGKNDDFGFGSYSYNLNGLINSQEWSVFLKKLPMLPDQYEGFSYLGLGVIILIIIAIILTIVWFKKDKESLMENKKLLISLIVITVLSTIVALSPKAYIGEHLLYELKLPTPINNLWGVFRSTGRMIWPVIHILTLSSIIVILKRLNWKYSLIIITLCIFIQIIDIGPILSQNHTLYATEYTIQEENDLTKYEYLTKASKNKKIKVLAFISNNLYDSDKMIYSDWALKHNIKTTKMHFARTSFEKTLEKNTNKLLKKKDESTLFLFTDKQECEENELNCYKLPSNYYIGYIKPLE